MRQQNAEGLTNFQLCQVFLAAMPQSWQNNFSLTVYNTTLQSMRAYMDKQSVEDPFVPKNKNNNTDSTNGKNNSNQHCGGNHQNNSTHSGNNCTETEMETKPQRW